MKNKIIALIGLLLLASSCLFAKENIEVKPSYQVPKYNVGKWLSSDQNFILSGLRR